MIDVLWLRYVKTLIQEIILLLEKIHWRLQSHGYIYSSFQQQLIPLLLIFQF